MCGVAGWTGHRADATWLVGAMGSALSHRGPDAAGQWVGDTGGLVFRRLALLDLEQGHQPACDERRRFWSIFNGEIYNHVELRRDLTGLGHRLLGHGDAELVPHLYEQWGPAFLGRLRGMFTIAVHDSANGELFLARDAFGIKPLYYTQVGTELLFASDVGALRAAGVVGGEPDPQALWHYLSFGHVPDPLTMWPGVRMLPAGHWLRWRRGQLEVQRWWSPEFAPEPGLSLDDAAELIDQAVQNSVAAHLIADVPVGAYLSSGVDSSLLVALAVRQQPVRTFSIGFEGSSGDHRELSRASELAAALGTDHEEQIITEQEYWQRLPEIVGAQEEPLADPSAPALWFLARAAAPHVKAVLSGEGADELFAGYPIYQQPHTLRAVTGLPSVARRGLRRFADRLPNGQWGQGYLQRGTTPLEQRFLGNAPLFSEDDKRLLMPQASCGKPLTPSAELLSGSYQQTGGLDDVARMQAASCQTWLASSILLKADKMAMAHSVEVRVPYLDREVFAIASRLPLALRVNANATKVAFRAAAARTLPREIADRPKLGFPVPFRSWLEGDLGAHMHRLFWDCDDPLLDRNAVTGLLQDVRRPDRQQRVWAMMTYLLWRQAQPTATRPPC